MFDNNGAEIVYNDNNVFAIENARYMIAVAAAAFDDGDHGYASAMLSDAVRIMAENGHVSFVRYAGDPA